MAREVTLKINVEDGEVKVATTSLNRLEKAAADVGKGGKGLNELKTASTGAAEGMSSVLAAVGPIAGVLAAAAAGFAAVTSKLFEFAKQAASFADQIQNVATRTGLTTDAVQALKYAAESSGKSLDSAGDSVAKFNTLLGQARDGNRKALETLKSYNITTLESNSALQQAVTAINARETADRKAAAAAALFKDENGEIIPIIANLNGSFDEQIKKLQDLGILIDGKSISSAKRYFDQMKELERQLEAVKLKIGSEVTPVFLDMATKFSDWLSRNKGEVESWARTIALSFDAVITGSGRLARLMGALASRDWFAVSGIVNEVSTSYDRDLQQRLNLARKNDLLLRSVRDNNLGSILADGTIPSLPEKAGRTPKTPFQLSSEGRALVNAAATLGVSPLDLAMIISFETRGTFSPSIRGGAGRNYLGLIQFGKQEQEQYGASAGQSFEQQITTSVVKYFQDRFGKAGRTTEGASLLDLYTTVLAGKPNANPDATDSFGTSARSGVAKMLREHRETALGRFFGGSQGNIPGGIEDLEKMLLQRSDELTSAERDSLTQTAIDMYLRAGLIPDKKMLERFKQLMVDHARETGEAQPTIEDIAQAFAENRAARQTSPVATTDATISGTFTPRRTVDQEYVDLLREGLQLEQRVTDIVLQRRNLQAIISDEVKSYNLSLEEAAIAAEKEYQILLKRNLAAEAGNDALFERNALIREVQDLEKAIANLGVNDGLIIQAEYLRTILNLRNRELDAVITIQRAQIELSQAMEISGNQIRAQVYDHLASQRTLNDAIADGINQTYDELGARLDDSIDKMFEWAGAFKSLFTEPLKAVARNGLTNITKGLLDAIAPGLGGELTKTNNPIARPIVDKLDDTNKLLGQIVRATGQSPAVSGLGSFVGALSGLAGLGGGGGGVGPGGTPFFNPNAGTGFGGGSILDGINIGSGGFDPATGTYSNAGGGGFLSRITGPGGIFGKDGFGNNVGTYGAIGAGAGLLGGLIGGRVGGIISSAGAGAALGAQIGSIIPGVGTAIGAVVGAIGGFLAGLFGGDPKRKRDKNEKIPALNKGFNDAFAELRKILEDIRFLRVDPDEALSRANEVRSQMASGFGIQFESKKYRKQAQATISRRLTEADVIIAEIKAAAAVARG
ncbi:MAG: hypothetical protein AB7J13_07355, partial [Pyrinomonadaceae bacterium]